MTGTIREESGLFRYFCENVSVNGWKYAIDGHSTRCIRFLWVLCHILLMAITVLLVRNLWQTFMDNPTLTLLESMTHPIADIPFPGISVCNVNKISKRKATAYALYLTNLTGKSMEEMLKKVKLLGYLYDFDTANDENLVEFQDFFDSIGEHPATVLRELAPKCEDFLLKCIWGGNTVNCSEHFQFLVTFEGHCCIFNYLKVDHGTEYPKVKYQKKKGFDSGLSVHINNDPSDFFYTNFPTEGVNIHIFTPSDFPDMVSGSLSQVLAGMGTETFLAIKPSVYKSSRGIQKYPLEKRQCFFGPEKPTIFGQYSESDCLVSCRVKMAKKLCGCVPFHVPVKDNVVCNLLDIPCLTQYRSEFISWYCRRYYVSIVDSIPFQVKWRTIRPADVDDEALAVETENGLRCDFRCFPSCDSILYGFSSNSPKLFLNHKNSEITENTSIVHIYFEDPFVNVYKQDETFLWFEILGNFGGIISLSLGFSFISAIEIFVLCIKYTHSRMKYRI